MVDANEALAAMASFGIEPDVDTYNQMLLVSLHVPLPQTQELEPDARRKI